MIDIFFPNCNELNDELNKLMSNYVYSILSYCGDIINEGNYRKPSGRIQRHPWKLPTMNPVKLLNRSVSYTYYIIGVLNEEKMRILYLLRPFFLIYKVETVAFECISMIWMIEWIVNFNYSIRYKKLFTQFFFVHMPHLVRIKYHCMMIECLLMYRLFLHPQSAWFSWGPGQRKWLSLR